MDPCDDQVTEVVLPLAAMAAGYAVARMGQTWAANQAATLANHNAYTADGRDLLASPCAMQFASPAPSPIVRGLCPSDPQQIFADEPSRALAGRALLKAALIEGSCSSSPSAASLPSAQVATPVIRIVRATQPTSTHPAHVGPAYTQFSGRPRIGTTVVRPRLTSATASRTPAAVWASPRTCQSPPAVWYTPMANEICLDNFGMAPQCTESGVIVTKGPSPKLSDAFGCLAD